MAQPIWREEQSGDLPLAGDGLACHAIDPPADVPERQGGGQSFDPLLLDELLDEKCLDGSSWIAATCLDRGGNFTLHLVRVVRGLNLTDHRCLPLSVTLLIL